MIELDKVYDPRAVEGEMYALWERSGAFRAVPANTPHEQTYTIVIPPPNVTGALHLGHALNNSLQDILVRYHRMRGFNTLWQPGTDHAGIATQAVVERRIKEHEGKTRHELGRDELVKRIWAWKDEYEKRILGQLKLMGCSCDWGYREAADGTFECDWHRTRFTLDEGLARAVRHIFFMLFRDGFVFRGKRLVNWDVDLQTAVADDEIYHETVPGKFWHFRYPIIEPKPGEPEFVIIATTRPETMLGDTAVAVNPDAAGALDRAEKKLRDNLATASTKDRPEIDRKLEAIAERRTTHLPTLEMLARMARDGRKVRLPLVCRPIPLIADEWADPSLGSGCVKITPAHDPNDYEVGVRHKLPMLNVLTPDGKIARILEADGSLNANSANYEGLVFTSTGRDKVVADMESRGLIESIEDRDREVGHSDRSKTPIEPYLSDQWFVRTGDGEATEPGSHGATKGTGLAQMAMDAVTDGRVRIFPERYAKTYLDWLGEKRDWCISRQLWWGHRIPVWRVPNSLFQTLLQRPDIEEISRRLNSYLAGGRAFRSHWGDAMVHFTVERGEWHEALRGYWCPGPGVEEEFRAFVEPLGFVQDPDVLDTWFSSALWPFSTLGWPEETAHLKQYYPGSVLVTSRDIITNWVARMVMFGLYAKGEVPFDRVYITPKVLDGRGETMSKSKGNGVDPVDIIHTYGADALRYCMADMTTETQDIRMPVEYLCPHCGKLTDQSLVLKTEEQSRKSRGEKLDRKLQPADCKRARCSHKECGKEFATQWADAATREQLGHAREASEKFEIGRNFCNKLWNAARFAFNNLDGATCERIDLTTMAPEDRWILAKLSQTVRRVHGYLDHYQFSAMVKELRDFFWDNLCDWYIELTKPRMSDKGQQAANAKQVLAFCLDQVLRLWHPVIPYITERLWQQLNSIVPQRGLPGIADLKSDVNLVVAEYPPLAGYPALDDDGIVETFGRLQEASRAVRELRTKAGVSPKDQVNVTVIVPADHLSAFRANAHILKTTAWIDRLEVSSDGLRPVNSASAAVRGLRVYVHDISDDAAEKTRATGALADIEKQVAGKEAKLNNAGFVANAKPEIIAAERERLSQLLQQREALRTQLAELGV